MTRTLNMRRVAANWDGPKSICQCGHTGDGLGGQHGHTVAYGHGACRENDCDCRKFAWKSWTDDFRKAIGAAGSVR